jgi:competence protein ComEA
LKKLIYFIKDALNLTINEAKGALLLFLIIAIALGITFFYSEFSSGNQSQVVIRQYGRVEVPKGNESNDFKKKYTYHGSTKLSYKTFPFDPNQASESSLIALGIPHYTAKTILKYRNKGGKFKFKEDLLKIYSLKPEVYERLQEFIMLPSKLSSPSFDNREEKLFSSPPEHLLARIGVEKTTPAKERRIEKFDINQADTSQLIRLNGIGSVFAKRIIKYRDLLGGFHSLNQVEETYGISEEAVAEIKKMAFVQAQIKKININSLEGVKHPYLKFSHLKTIKAYKAQHGPLRSIEDLRNIKNIEEETIQKISPYLIFD